MSTLCSAIPMICKKCNHTYSDDLDSCPLCGEPKPSETTYTTVTTTAPASSGRAEDNASDSARGSAQQAQTVWQQPQALPAAQEGKNGTSALVLGILSLLIPYVGIVLGILAIVFGNTAKKTNLPGTANYGFGQAGWVLGIVGLAFQAFLVIYVAAVLGFVFNMLDNIMDYGDFQRYGYYGGYFS